VPKLPTSRLDLKLGTYVASPVIDSCIHLFARVQVYVSLLASLYARACI
jgi:hypothetical protein